MSRRIRFQVYLIVAAHLLLAVPAMSSAFVAAAAESACGTMVAAEHGDHCPCCPDGVSTMTDCLVSCTLAAAIPAGLIVTDPISLPAAPALEQPTPASHFDDPPPEPPPIR